MAKGLNKVQIIGNLGRDPEMRYTASGMAVTTFSVAVNRGRRDPQNGQLVEEAEWFRISAWDKLAETCNEYLQKGHRVYVEGRLQSRKYTDKDSVERTSVEIVASDMIMLGGREDGAAVADDSAGQSAGVPQGSATRRAAGNSQQDDDIPF